ncbi:class I SAM-dependent methyltransferase [Candidatus Woesearchaeota archaeon]|nr:class I SAM-dependent methyltransferase [Candidatus Woesearchaeota archaeon]
MLNDQNLKEKCDMFAPYYDTSEYLSEILGIRKLRKNLVRSANGRVLELGIGTGKNLPYYPDSCEIVGIDFSSEMLKIASKRANRLNKKISLYLMNCENLSFLDNSFDTIVDSFNLCTYIHPLRVLEETKRICKDNGKILFLEHGISKCGLLAKLQDLTSERHANTMGCNWNKDIYSIILESGLKIKSVEYSFYGILVSIRANPDKN